MFILGLTGSIGMGKSTTAKMFAEEGVPVHDADAVVHRLYEGEAAPAIEAAFPGTTDHGKVNRDKLGQRVLGNELAMKRLEHIVHPLVRQAEERFLAEAKKKGAKAALLDIPLLYETAGDKHCDAVVVVSAPAVSYSSGISSSAALAPFFFASAKKRSSAWRTSGCTMCSSRFIASSLPSTRWPSLSRFTLPWSVVPGNAASIAGAASPS